MWDWMRRHPHTRLLFSPCEQQPPRPAGYAHFDCKNPPLSNPRGENAVAALNAVCEPLEARYGDIGSAGPIHDWVNEPIYTGSTTNMPLAVSSTRTGSSYPSCGHCRCWDGNGHCGG